MNRRHFVMGMTALPWLAACRGAWASRPAAGLLRLAGDGEPGIPMRLSGTIYDPDGTTPRPGARLFVYQTDHDGYYSRPRNDPRQARLRGWVETDSHGRYAIITIQPGHYPGRQSARHIHVHLDAPALDPHWIDSFFFAGDPYLYDDQGRVRPYGQVVALSKGQDGVLRGMRDLRIDPRLAVDNRLVDGWYR